MSNPPHSAQVRKKVNHEFKIVVLNGQHIRIGQFLDLSFYSHTQQSMLGSYWNMMCWLSHSQTGHHTCWDKSQPVNWQKHAHPSGFSKERIYSWTGRTLQWLTVMTHCGHLIDVITSKEHINKSTKLINVSNLDITKYCSNRLWKK